MLPRVGVVELGGAGSRSRSAAARRARAARAASRDPVVEGEADLGRLAGLRGVIALGGEPCRESRRRRRAEHGREGRRRTGGRPVAGLAGSRIARAGSPPDRPRPGGPAGRRAARWRESRPAPARSSSGSRRSATPSASRRSRERVETRRRRRRSPGSGSASSSGEPDRRRPSRMPAASAPVPGAVLADDEPRRPIERDPDRFEVPRDRPAEDRMALRAPSGSRRAPGPVAPSARPPPSSSRPPGRTARAP